MDALNTVSRTAAIIYQFPTAYQMSQNPRSIKIKINKLFDTIVVSELATQMLICNRPIPSTPKSVVRVATPAIVLAWSTNGPDARY